MKNGDLLNHMYRIIRPLGSGGVGTIYLAWHENLQKYVVIKRIKDHCVDLIDTRSEVDILKGLHHMYLPQVYDFVQIDSEVFTVMDYIAGRDLKYYLDCGYRFSEEQIILWLHQLLDVLEYLHTRTPKIIHCDIKPANIMITEEGNVCLIDFNISLEGENNKELIGLSNQFASPEQVKKAEYKLRYGSSEGIAFDERSDLYSLGSVLYYMMTGIVPNARRMDLIPISIVGTDVNPYSEALTNIVDKAMQENPDKRFRSAAKMHDAVNHMELWTNTYKKLTRIGNVLDVTAFFGTMILLCVMIIGHSKMRTEQFFNHYNAYVDQVKTLYDMELTVREDEKDVRDSALEILSDGIDFLNMAEYENQFKNHKEAKANILYGVGQAAMYLSDYRQALNYLEEASLYNPENGAIYRDLAIANIRSGEESEAIEAKQSAIQYGINRAEIEMIEAEHAYMNGDYLSAYEKTTAAIENTLDDADHGNEIVQRSALIAVDSAEKSGKTKECVEFTLKMSKESGWYQQIFWLRKAGEICAKNVGTEEAGEYYVKQGIQCYKAIHERGYGQLTDLLNLAFLYESNGEFIACRDLLMEMYSEYPEEYEVPLRLASILYRIENTKASSNRDYNPMAQYFDKAMKICSAQNKDWSQDVVMVQMKDIVESLRDRGVIRD